MSLCTWMINILAPDFAIHLRYLSRVAQYLRDAELLIRFNKSNFKKIKYLVGGGLLKMHPGRVEAIRRIPNLQMDGTADSIKISALAGLAAPLTECL